MSTEISALTTLRQLAEAVAIDINNNLMFVLNSVDLALDHLGVEHPASVSLLEAQRAVARCAQTTQELQAYLQSETARKSYSAAAGGKKDE